MRRRDTGHWTQGKTREAQPTAPPHSRHDTEPIFIGNFVIAYFCDRVSRCPCICVRWAPYHQRMSKQASVMERSNRMFRKLTIALVATAALGTAALTSSAAEAHWRGYGWYGGHDYGHSYWNHSHYGYGYGHYGYKPRFYGYPRYFHRHHAGWKRFRYGY
jgi:hypothetical protein